MFCPYLCQTLTEYQSLVAGAFCEKFVVKWLLNIPTASLHYLVKYKICKIHQYSVKIWRCAKKLRSKLLFISSPKTDGFYRFYISQGSVATHLRCGGMFNNRFITNFHRMRQWKCWKSVNNWQRYGQNFMAYFFGPHYMHYVSRDWPSRSVKVMGDRTVVR